ncbi:MULTISPECIES: hypothetical protein [Gulosibacter]|uniref:hypothetical protein n=1 Tax=Gulosibacter TaxID=256818 RepID=UPI000F64250B|nr:MULTISPECIES: hypothetical protein [Gulosibacter]
MQIGTRWSVGSPAPSSIPAPVAEACSKLEADGDFAGDWTLTWLEGRAIATHTSGLRVLEREDGTAATLAAGETELDLDDDDWLG